MHDQNRATLTEEKKESFNLLIDHLIEGIICIRFDGTIAHYNLTAATILEKSQELVLNSPFLNHFNDHLFGFSIRKTLAEKKAPSIQYSTLSFPEKTVQLKINCHFNKETLILIFQDQTEIKKTESLAHASSRLKDLGTMTALLAHEIRNPLGGIKGFASLLRQDLEKQPNLKQMADLIIDGTDHLNRLVTQILNFAHPLQLKLKEIDLLSLVQNLKKLLYQDTRLNNKLISHEIEFKIKNNINEKLILQGDEELISSCLLNLMINAIQAMPNGGILEIGLEMERLDATKYTKITVSDTGMGISKENLKKIFSAFFTTKKEGNGFGLLEVHKVVHAHNGTIDVESELDKGTNFIIKIPNSAR